MANKKKIYCYTYDILKNKDVCKKDYLVKLVKAVFKARNENSENELNKVLIFSDDDDNYSLELLNTINGKEIDENYLFFRIGKQKEIEGVIKRDKKTLISEEVLDKEQQNKYDLEICTYILIDKESGILLELYGQFAPSTKSFIYMINSSMPQKFKDESISIRHKNILTEKMINSFKEGGVRLGKIGYTYTIPKPEVLSTLGLTTKQIKALQELDVFEVEVTIKNRTRLPLTKVPSKIKSTVSAFSECASSIKKSLVFSGCTGNSDSKEYRFSEEEVTYPITINNTRNQDGLEIKLSLDEMTEQIYNKMKLTYRNNKKFILEYVK